MLIVPINSWCLRRISVIESAVHIFFRERNVFFGGIFCHELNCGVTEPHNKNQSLWFYTTKNEPFVGGTENVTSPSTATINTTSVCFGETKKRCHDLFLWYLHTYDTHLHKYFKAALKTRFLVFCCHVPRWFF